MFRNVDEKSEGEVSSDDDGPMVKNARHSAEEPTQQQKSISKKNPWGELIIERELDRVGAVQVEDKIIERDCESFAIPAEADFENSEQNGKPKSEKKTLPPPMIAVSPADEDDPFAGPPDDLANVEKFGFDSRPSTSNEASRNHSNSSRQNSKRGRGSHSGNDRLNGRVSIDDRYISNERAQGAKDPKAHREQSRGTRGAGPRGMTMRGKNGPRGMSRGGVQGLGRGGAGAKRTHDQMKGLHYILAPEYSVEKLLAAEFEEDLTVQELGQEIANALGEKDPDLVCNIVQVLGKDLALRIFEKTRDVEAGGGMMVQDGSRRRSPGGVFMMIYRDDPSISQRIKDEISALSVQKSRTIKRAKRKKDRSGKKIDAKAVSNQPRIEQDEMTENEIPEIIKESGDQELELDYE